VSTLEGKIDGAAAATAKLSDELPAASATVAETYRCMHSIVGIGPTVGFPSTGHAARQVEDVLRSSYRDRRGLTSDEILLFTQRLQALRDAGARELQSFYSVGRWAN
jgi:chemotaxis protein histidine kinase CheA